MTESMTEYDGVHLYSLSYFFADKHWSEMGQWRSIGVFIHSCHNRGIGIGLVNSWLKYQTLRHSVIAPIWINKDGHKSMTEYENRLRHGVLGLYEDEQAGEDGLGGIISHRRVRDERSWEKRSGNFLARRAKYVPQAVFQYKRCRESYWNLGSLVSLDSNSCADPVHVSGRSSENSTASIIPSSRNSGDRSSSSRKIAGWWKCVMPYRREWSSGAICHCKR